jgi:hypothetical protein
MHSKLLSGASLNDQIEKIRFEIRDLGESVYSYERLHSLFPDISPSGQWDAIARIALREHWSFTFSSDGSVCFAEL